MEEKFNEMKKKCPMFIKPDLFLIGEVLLILLIALFVVASKEQIGTEKSRKNFLIYGGFGSLFVCYVAQDLCGKAKVKNRLGSDINIWRKEVVKIDSHLFWNQGKVVMILTA